MSPSSANDSNATLVNPFAPTPKSKPRVRDYDASFGALASVYGYGGALAGPPPVDIVPSKKKAARAKPAPADAQRQDENAAFGRVATTYGSSGAFPAPLDFPSKKSAHSARTAHPPAVSAHPTTPSTPASFGDFAPKHGLSSPFPSRTCT
ncbi:hypothetical protein OF83DRAFT_1080513 [Amylostereum chailletii]|nr:hypothetical protein OF83DRAFT_1080513 [Amylostereum chailletii]